MTAPRHYVLQWISARHGVTKGELRGPSRKRHIVLARWEAMAILREHGMSFPAIGLMLNRHHSAVIRGLRRLA